MIKQLKKNFFFFFFNFYLKKLFDKINKYRSIYFTPFFIITTIFNKIIHKYPNNCIFKKMNNNINQVETKKKFFYKLCKKKKI